MIVYLVRHAPAEERQARRSDAARPLTEEGRSRMARAARGLAQEVGRNAVLLTSPLLRARQTAEILRDALGHDRPRPPRLVVTETLSPPGDLEGFLALVREAGGAEEDAVLAIGHEPCLSAWLGQLCFGRIGRCALRKGGAAALQFEAGAATGQLLWLLQPRQLRALG